MYEFMIIYFISNYSVALFIFYVFCFQIFQQLMSTCASRATHHFPELHSWAGLYNQNQGLKYLEAITILYSRDMCLSKGK
jgi:hypothetical protein